MKKMSEQVFVGNKFQYNYCFGGTFIPFSFLYSLFKFQYNYCFGGTELILQKLQMYLAFQYNYCFGGTQQDLFIQICQAYLSFNTTIVSVELFRFRYFIICNWVSIQLLFRWNVYLHTD